MMAEKRFEERYRSLSKRAFHSFLLIAAILLIGTITFHYIENYSYINAFFFMSMLATGQGPPFTPATDLGKIAASIMAFVSTGTVVVALIFIFGPFFGRFLRLEETKLKKEERTLLKDIEK